MRQSAGSCRSVKALGSRRHDKPSNLFTQKASPLQPALQDDERSIGIRAWATDEDIQRSQLLFGPGMDRDVRLREQRDPRHALTGSEMMKPNLEQRHSRCLSSFPQRCLDSGNVGQIRVAEEISDQMPAGRGRMA